MVFTVFTTLSLISIGIYLIYYKSKSCKPKVFAKPNSNFSNYIASTCPILNARYFPTWWTPCGHGTTIGRHFFQSRLFLKYKIEELFTKDGRNFITDWYPEPSQNSDYILVIIPGITANSQTPYTEHLCASASKLNLQVVVCNHRGSRDEKVVGEKINCATETQPLIALLDCLKERYPSSKIIALGVSLGGMILTKYLSDAGVNSKVSYGIAVCMPWDCFQTQISLEKSFISRKVYNDKLSGNLRKFTRVNIDNITKATGIRQQDIELMKTISIFDSKVVVPMYGYKSLEEYYMDASPAGRVDRIAIPFISLNTRDDPFVPWRSIPIQEFERNSNSMLLLTEAGGHVGFIEGTIPREGYYLSRLLSEVFQSLIAHSKE
ncbi:Abhydrolase domain-containing protein 1 isoform X2 [Oopsacas minuta]|uniref:Abhydrolase domain-containing protein 1 isoform X2 n=1 Tax=Oopsacas minuta TaxID=111878 RepID=A0AAV7KJ11_9METZ|nr:Abhydrolase domain-containing protein 1 isoform X2 [Oopsacas minuta]